jgi:hypothetical protein
MTLICFDLLPSDDGWRSLSLNTPIIQRERLGTSQLQHCIRSQNVSLLFNTGMPELLCHI